MNLEDRVFHQIANFSLPHFFITVEFAAKGTEMPNNIESFLINKYTAIQQGATGRKFVYREGEWRLIFTFFPTNRVVDERYALKNKVALRHHLYKRTLHEDML